MYFFHSLSLPVPFWFSLRQWKEKAALINRSESFSTPQWFQAQLGKLNIIKAQGKGCTFLEIARGVVQKLACYRRKHAAMHVQYTMPGHRGSTELQLYAGGRGGVGEREDGSHYRARKTLLTCLSLAHMQLLMLLYFYHIDKQTLEEY